MRFRNGLSVGLWASLCLWLGACGGIQLDPTPPPGFDLSGTWLVVDSGEPPPTPRNLRARGSMLAFVTQDFPILRAKRITVEQNRDSMGVRYDGGDYRDVSWGTRQRGLWEVRAGWNEGALVILWDADDAKAQETLTLSDGGQRLTVNARIESRGDRIDIQRVFERQ